MKEREDQSTEYRGDRPLVDVARESGSALRDTGRWLHRRVERIYHTERSLVRRKISVDFTIPSNLPSFHEGDSATGIPSVFFVPVALLRKWPPLMEFDLRASDGCPIPLLTSQRNRAVDAAALVSLAPDGNERKCLQSQLESIATSDADGSRKALDAVGIFLGERLDNLSPEDQVAWARTLRAAGSLVRNSLLWVRVEGQYGDRQLIKFAFSEQAPQELLLRRRILAAFSWAPRRVQYELPNLGERGSYHLEIDVPPDLAIYRARLVLSDLPPSGGQVPKGPGAVAWTKGVFERLAQGARARQRELFGTVSVGEPGCLQCAREDSNL